MEKHKLRKCLFLIKNIHYKNLMDKLEGINWYIKIPSNSLYIYSYFIHTIYMDNGITNRYLIQYSRNNLMDKYIHFNTCLILYSIKMYLHKIGIYLNQYNKKYMSLSMVNKRNYQIQNQNNLLTGIDKYMIHSIRHTQLCMLGKELTNLNRFLKLSISCKD